MMTLVAVAFVAKGPVEILAITVFAKVVAKGI
jgi:hypothetical protein